MSVLSLVPEEKRNQRRDSVESVYSSSSRLTLLAKRKRAGAGLGGAAAVGGGDMAARDRFVAQRVLSAKTHRVKQLQNQLADAHYHLQELSNENKILRALQKKQEIALQRYENSNAELPQVLNAHNEELRVQHAKYKQLKAQFRDASARLKERDLQLQQLRDEHQHLLELSKDKNLLEREKLQSQVADLTAKVQQQNETISMLQRRIALEAKNFKHQLQNEINKHKDTRHDLDLAISNADKLSTIIEMKEKMISTVASRGGGSKSPTKMTAIPQFARPVYKPAKEGSNRSVDEKTMEQNILAKLCEGSRTVSSALSQDEDAGSSPEPLSRRVSARSTPSRAAARPKGPSDILELAKTVQDGMADLAIIDDVDLANAPPEDVQKKMDLMKTELMNQIKKNEQPPSRKPSALRRRSTEESIEECVAGEIERPKSRGRRNSTVSFYDTTNAETISSIINDGPGDEIDKFKVRRESSVVERKLSGKSVDKYCKDIFQDIEKSSKVIDVHMKQLSQARFASDKLVEQLQAVDRMNELVNARGDIPDEALSELNNNFQLLTDHVFTESVPITRKRSVSGRRNSRVESRSNLLGDASMSNQDLLDDLLGKK
ncbi:lebercilin [Zerene cesonia]|uniref:lebercilin n=1 Tax=Zerene cesonia TaxID=33412 RepID=UPI0018E58998|nr:lebercilin [Zerene cesonia]